MSTLRPPLARFLTWSAFGFWTLIGTFTLAWGDPEALFPHRAYAAGPLPVGVVVGDFNGDGVLDLVVADAGRNTTQQFHDDGVSVLLGRADGTFGPPTRFTAGRLFPHAPVAIVAGDFNGDGFLDVALANAPPPPTPPLNYDQGTVSVMLGHGDGTLGAQTHFAAGTYPVAIATGDLNGDGILDLVAPSDRANHVSVFMGSGDGTFAAPVAYATAASPKSVTIADFNGDGTPDLAVACAGAGVVSVLVGLGGGAFAPASAYPAGAGASAVAAGDLNGDGRPDLAVGNSIAHSISILRGVGDGTFTPGNAFGATQSAGVIRMSDLDGDGLLDLVEADNGNPLGLIVFRGHGDLQFTVSDRTPSGSRVRDLALADVDGDGHPDLVAARWDGDDVLVLSGRGDASFGPHPLTLGTGHRPEGIATTDLNGDGHPDLVVANYYDNTISIMLANGAGAFAPGVNLPAGSQPVAFATGDLNGDGSPDIAVANRASNDVSIYYGHGDGTFNPQLRLGAGAQPVELAIGDFDQDGHADLVVANWASLDLTEFTGRSDGTLAPGVRIPLNGLGAPTSLAVADFDGDGRPELAVGGTVLWILSAPPAGVLQVRSSEFSGCNGWAVATGDLNEDGHSDLTLECYQTGPTFLVWLGRGDGSFEAPVSYGTELGGTSLALADFDRDGHLDIAAGLSASALEVWFGTGDGGFGRAVRFAAGGPDAQLATADFDSDGKPDLAISNDGGEDRVWVLEARPNTAPVANAGPDIRVGCVSPQGTLVTLDGSRSSDPDSTPGTNDDIVQFSWYQDRGLPTQVLLGTGEKLGVSFGIGERRIDLVVTDHAGATSTDIMFVEVDVTPPSLSCPDLDSIECTGSAGTYVEVQATASSACAGPVRVTNTRTANGSDASGLYPLGSTVFQFVAVDTQGRRTTCLATVTVQDTQPPALQLVPDPAVLWPPNHGMVPVHVQVAAQDLCSPVTQIVLSSIESSEPDDAAGLTDGATANDIQGTDIGAFDTDVLLRAERDGQGPGRVYTLLYEATDGAGNAASGLATVTVPHDEGQGPEPLLMRVEPGGTPGMVRLYWPAVPDAVGYDVISGALSQISVQNGSLALGPVEVLARGTTDTEVSEGALGVIPSTGEGLFYLIKSRTARGGVGYGTESAPWPRVPSTCDGGCP